MKHPLSPRKSTQQLGHCGRVGLQSQSESLTEKPGFGPISFQASFLTTQEYKSQNHIGSDSITQLY